MQKQRDIALPARVGPEEESLRKETSDGQRRAQTPDVVLREEGV